MRLAADTGNFDIALSLGELYGFAGYLFYFLYMVSKLKCCGLRVSASGSSGYCGENPTCPLTVQLVVLIAASRQFLFCC